MTRLVVYMYVLASESYLTVCFCTLSVILFIDFAVAGGKYHTFGRVEPIYPAKTYEKLQEINRIRKALMNCKSWTRKCSRA